MADQFITKFRWTVKDFDMCPHPTGKRLESPVFNAGSYKFRLWLYPRGYQNPESTSVFISRLDDNGEQEVSVNYEICLIDDRGFLANVHRPTHRKFKKDIGVGWDPFIRRDYLLSKQRSKFLPKNNLTVECKVLSLGGDQSDEVDGDVYGEEDYELLSRDFADLLKNGTHSDLTIHVGGRKFMAHKAVLECRCPRLMEKLETTNIINEFSLPGIESSVMEILLQYLYSGTFSEWHYYKAMLIVSDRYKLPALTNDLVFPYSRSICASTEISVSRVSFEWTVKEFGKLQSGNELVYPAFCYTDNEWDEMKIVLGVTRNANGALNVELTFQKTRLDLTTFMRCKISIFKTGSSTTPVIVKEYEHTFKNESWLTPFGLETELRDIIFHDTLSMHFEVSTANSEDVCKIESTSVRSKPQTPGKKVIKNLKLLQQDLRALDDDKHFYDIVFLVGDERLTAHKAVLCARSPVFAKMFEHDTLENQEGVITIEDMDTATVKSLLRYIHCGHIDAMDVSGAFMMYSAADKYELLTLKDKCANILKSSVNADYVGEILLLADAHHDEGLKKCVYDYMASNPKEVLNSKNSLSVLKSRSDVYADILNVLLEHIASLNKEISSYTED